MSGDLEVGAANERALRRVFEEFADPQMIADVFAEDAEWHEPGAGPISGIYVGRDEIGSLFASVLSRSDGTFRILEVTDVLTSDQRGVAFVLVEGKRDDRHILTTDVVVFDLADGKIRRARVLSEDQAEVDAFWK